MSVLIEAFSVVARVDRLIEKVENAYELIFQTPVNQTLCSDSEVFRIGFMALVDAVNYQEYLKSLGLEDDDVVIVQQDTGPLEQRDWIEYLVFAVDKTSQKTVCAAQLKGSKQKFFNPNGWEYERSLSNNTKFLTHEEIIAQMEFIETQDGTDVYRDRETGDLYYVGRTGSN